MTDIPVDHNPDVGAGWCDTDPSSEVIGGWPAFRKGGAISLRVKQYVLGSFLGKYRSLFRGKGMDYDEIRKYVPGDDPKAFVWSKLAQLGEAYTKTFLEERDLSVIIAIDTSGSVFWNRRAKAQLVLEAAAILIYSAAVSRDQIGLVLFSEGVDRSIPPRRGIRQAGRLIEELMNIRPGRRRTQLTASLRDIGARRGPKRAVIFLLSDFVSSEEGWQSELASLARRNDVIALTVTDDMEWEPPPVGWIYAQDPEEGCGRLLHASPSLCLDRQQRNKKARADLFRFMAHHRVGTLELSEGQDPLVRIREFFERRRGGSEIC